MYKLAVSYCWRAIVRFRMFKEFLHLSNQDEPRMILTLACLACGLWLEKDLSSIWISMSVFKCACVLRTQNREVLGPIPLPPGEKTLFQLIQMGGPATSCLFFVVCCMIVLYVTEPLLPKYITIIIQIRITLYTVYPVFLMMIDMARKNSHHKLLCSC